MIRLNTAAKIALTRPLHSFAAAWRFLTVFPGILPAKDDQRYFVAGPYYFTLVGIAAGALVGAAGFLLMKIAPPVVVGVIVAIALSMVSGFLHLDGLADTIDGFMSCRDRERSLAIMKDSRIGVMGAVSIGAVLLLKAAALMSVPVNELISVVVISSAAGRTATVLMMSFLPYARAEGGIGNLFLDENSALAASIISVVIFIGAILVLAPHKTAVLTIMFILTMVLFGTWCVRKIGGYTGDTLGAVCELTEAAMLTGAVLSF